MRPQSSAPFEVPGDDPFGGLDVEAQPADAADLFTAPPPPAPRVPETSRVTQPTVSAPTTSPSSSASSSTGADMQKLRRLEAVQRFKEIAWGVAQAALFLAFLVVAVVLGRGGSLERLAQGDVAGAFAGEAAASGLSVEDVRVTRRLLASGTAIVVVTGLVHNKTDQPVAAARVDVRFGDDPATPGAPDARTAASGWAWSSIDGVDVDALPDATAAPALSMRPPKSAELSPGDRAPFVVLAPAPPEGTRVHIVASSAPGATALAPPAVPPAAPAAAASDAAPAAPAAVAPVGAVAPPAAGATKVAPTKKPLAPLAKPVAPLAKPIVPKAKPLAPKPITPAAPTP